MLCARVVRGAASSAGAVPPAPASRCRPAASSGSSMPTTVAPARSRGVSAGEGARPLRTPGPPPPPPPPPHAAPLRAGDYLFVGVCLFFVCVCGGGGRPPPPPASLRLCFPQAHQSACD